MQQDYNNTINLPKTEFPMRAGLPKREPGFLENWEKNDLYHELMKKNEGKPLFVLHDGPPYAIMAYCMDRSKVSTAEFRSKCE